MKIEFIEEKKVNGEISYSTEIDGHYVANSISLDKEFAKVTFERILKNKGVEKRTVLLSLIIEENEK